MALVFKTLIATIFAGAFLAHSAMAQDVRVFESKDSLEAEIAKHLADGTFSALVETVAPPSRMGTGRIRALENASEGQMPSFTKSAPVLSGGDTGGFTREVTAWWDGTTYVFLGLVTHQRSEDVVVLDFLITSDFRRAARWYLSGEADQRL